MYFHLFVTSPPPNNVALFDIRQNSNSELQAINTPITRGALTAIAINKTFSKFVR